MEIRSGLEGLRSLLGVDQAAPAAAERKSQAAPASGPGGDRATVSSAASELAQASVDEGVRTEKVVAIQAALARRPQVVSEPAGQGQQMG
jgi:hypothetical protein